MEIRAFDEAALADDQAMRVFYDLNRRAKLLRPAEGPFWEFQEFLGAFRSPDSGERQEMFAAYDGDRMVGNAMMWSFLLDNLDKVAVRLSVDVPDRRRGVGRALVEQLEQVAKDDGRSLMMSERHLAVRRSRALTPTDASRRRAATSSPTSRWSDTCPLPVRDELIQEWVDEAASHQRGYTIETFVGAVPDDLVESLCVLFGQLAVDAPTGLVDFDEEDDHAAAVRRDGGGPRRAWAAPATRRSP